MCVNHLLSTNGVHCILHNLSLHLFLFFSPFSLCPLLTLFLYFSISLFVLSISLSPFVFQSLSYSGFFSLFLFPLYQRWKMTSALYRLSVRLMSCVVDAPTSIFTVHNKCFCLSLEKQERAEKGPTAWSPSEIPSEYRGSLGLDLFWEQMGAIMVCSVCSEDSHVRARPALAALKLAAWRIIQRLNPFSHCLMWFMMVEFCFQRASWPVYGEVNMQPTAAISVSYPVNKWDPC